MEGDFQNMILRECEGDTGHTAHCRLWEVPGVRRALETRSGWVLGKDGVGVKQTELQCEQTAGWSWMVGQLHTPSILT